MPAHLQPTARRARPAGWGAALALALAAVFATPAAARTPKVGDPAPDFHATLYGGRKVTLADFRGEVLILNFWATWCGPCKTELPLLDSYLRVTQSHGLHVLAVASEDSAAPYQLKPLAAAMAMPMVSHLGGPYADLGGYPTNYVIDRAGVVRYAKAGAFNLDALNAVVLPLLNEPRPEPTPAGVATVAPTPSS